MRRPVILGVLLSLLSSSAVWVQANEAPLASGGSTRSPLDPDVANEISFLLDQSAHESGLENEDQSLRQKAFLDAHRDDAGRLRPDLWLEGLEAIEDLPVTSTWPAADGIAAELLNDPVGTLTGSAPTRGADSAAASPIVGVQWTQIGPEPLRVDPGMPFGDTTLFQGDGPSSGEVTDIAISPAGSTDRTIYIATNDGGIWKTTDGGDTWEPKSDQEVSLSMGAVALDPSNSQIVYAGTGNGFDGGCLFTKGAGILKSVNGGNTWTTLGGTLFNNVMIHRIRVLTDGTLLVGSGNGLFRSEDGGLTFGNNAAADNNTATLTGNITDIDIDTANATTVYASVSNGGGCPNNSGGTSGLFRSIDSGETFPTNLFAPAAGTPPATGRGYIAMAQGTTDPQTMYATVATGGGAWDGLYRTTDGGATWDNPAAANTPATNCQCAYDQVIGVDPLDEDRLYIGFQEIWLSTDGGTTFAATAVSDHEVHWDQHAMYFSPASHLPAAAPSPIWAGHDGGISVSTDGSANWDNKNEGIATNLFKEIDMGRGAGNNDFTYGGMQDTGTAQRQPGYPGNDWHEAINGDGLSLAVDPTTAMHALTIDNGRLFVTTNGGTTWTGPQPLVTGPITCGPSTRTNTIGLLQWDLTDDQNVWGAAPTCGFGSGNQLLRSTDNGATFTVVYTAPSTIRWIDIDRQDSDAVWLGLADGTVERSTDALGAATFSPTATQPGPGRAIKGLAINPDDSNHVVVTYQGFSGTAAGLRTAHVFQTEDGGATWADISGTDGGSENLPDLPTHSVVIDSGTTPATIIVSNDAGVLRTVDGGATWQRLGTGLPKTDSVTLVLDDTVSPPILRLGTYGRSVFELTAATGPALALNCDLGFDRVPVGRRATRTCEVFNVGTSDLHILSFTRTAGSPDFSIISGPSTPTTISPGNHLDWTIEFRPTSGGDQTATFTIQSDDPNSPHHIPASGTGVTGDIRLTGDLHFGTVARGTTASRPATVTNVGEGFLTVNSRSIVGDPEFSVDPSPATPLTLGPGESVDFTVRFSPPATDNGDPRTATFHVMSDDPDTPDATLAASGRAGVPQTGASSGELHFLGVPVDDRTDPRFRDKIVTVFNQASCDGCDVFLTSHSITGPNASDFTLVDPPLHPYKLGAGNHLDYVVRFNPSDVGDREATLTITTDDPAQPIIRVDLDGSGLIPGISTPHNNTLQPNAGANGIIFPPTVYDPVCVSPCGTTITENYFNNGQAELIVDSIVLSGSPAFSGPPATEPPSRFAPNDGAPEPILFRPTGGAARRLTGTMTITDTMGPDPTAADVTRSVALCGESVGRGFRVLAVDANGTPFQSLKALKLNSFGFHKNVNQNYKNLQLTTLNPPTTCEKVQFQYENQTLPDTDRAGNQGAYYKITLTAGNQAKTLSFTLGINEFKTIVMTIP